MLKIGQVDWVEIVALIDDHAGFDTPYLAQHGICLLVTVRAGTLRKRILVDTGQSAEPVLHNMALLGIDPCSIDMVFLSHCHYDHTHGLVGILERVGKAVPVFAHPGLFRTTVELKPSVRSIGIGQAYDGERVSQAGGQLMLLREPFGLCPGVVSTGEVLRTVDPEAATLEAYNVEGGQLVKDTMVDDLSLIVNVRDEGLVIVTGCAHAGILNIVAQATELTAVQRLAGIIGGLHLINSSAERIEKVTQGLAAMQPGWVVAGHCTGLAASQRLSSLFGDRFALLHAGKRIYIGDGGSSI